MLVLPYRGVWPRIAEDAFIAPTAVIVGDVTIESGANIWFGAVLRGDAAPIRIGPRTNVQDGCVLHTDEGARHRWRGLHAGPRRDCAWRDDWRWHAGGDARHILNLAVVGAGCLIAAATLVPEGKRFAPGQMVMGVPGKAIRAVSEAEQARIRDGVAHYLNYAREYATALADTNQP